MKATYIIYKAHVCTNMYTPYVTLSTKNQSIQFCACLIIRATVMCIFPWFKQSLILDKMNHRRSGDHCALSENEMYGHNLQKMNHHRRRGTAMIFRKWTTEEGVWPWSSENEPQKKGNSHDLLRTNHRRKGNGDGSGRQPEIKRYPTHSKGGPAFAWSKTLSVDTPLEANNWHYTVFSVTVPELKVLFVLALHLSCVQNNTALTCDKISWRKTTLRTPDPSYCIQKDRI